MRFSSCLVSFVTAAVIGLSGCGGGGGSAGTTSGVSTPAVGGSGTGTVVVTPPIVSLPTITLGLQDSAGAATRAVSAAGFVTASATVRGADGVVIVGSKVTFDADAALLKISPANSVLTDSTGTAKVQISAASLSAAGAGTLGAVAVVGTSSLSANYDFQLSPTNLALSSLTFGMGTLPAYGNQSVSVQASINGAAATNTPVRVSFSASCGTVAPVSVSTDSTGRASTTYTADSALCAGKNVTVSALVASAVENSSVSGFFAVDTVKATNLQFVGAIPNLIYLAGSGSASQSQITFKVVDTNGNAVQNQRVNLGLGNVAAGTNISLDSIGSSAGVTKTTDVSGLVSVIVFSGDVPTSATVTAVLDAPLASVRSASNILTIASGVPVQKASSLAIEKLSIEGFNTDGLTSNVTFSLADRQGNPVPDGTAVNFVAESGVMLPARCVVTGGSSQCSSQIRTSGTRPSNGRVSVFAYTSGEEDFLDLNFNNKYDLGEPFTDLGNAYRDDDGSLDFSVGEFSVPRLGNVACTSVIARAESPVNSKAGSCDGIWGTNEVRREAVIIFATSEASISVVSRANPLITLRVADLNGNSMPVGSTITALKLSGSDECTVKRVSPGLIGNQLGFTLAQVDLDKCSGGSPFVPATPTTAAIPAVPADVIRVFVTSPGRLETSIAVVVSN